MMLTIRRYLLAGVLLWVPIGVTILVIKFIVDLLDQSLLLVPEAYRPDQLLGFHIPGLGVVISLILLLSTGMLITNFLGHKLLKMWDSLLAHIPLVRTIYTSVRQVLETIFSANEPSFRKVLLVEYPRKGLWSVAFQTGKGWDQTKAHTGEELVTVFVPTTPNPTSGFLLMVPVKDTKELDIGVDQALKFVISLGVVAPDGNTVSEEVLKQATRSE